MDFFTEAQHVMGKSFSYPYAFGCLMNRVRQYLRGDSSRDSFTAFFAQVDMLHSHYAESLAMVPDPADALKAALAACREQVGAPADPAEAGDETPVT